MKAALQLLSPAVLSALRILCERRAPLEACGAVFEGPDGARIVELRNALPPGQARTAYAFDPEEQLRVFSDADRRGETLRVLFHSHVDAPAAFSAEDHARAFPGGVALYPGVAYLILAIDRGHLAGAQLHAWDGSRLLGVPVPDAPWRGA